MTAETRWKLRFVVTFVVGWFALDCFEAVYRERECQRSGGTFVNPVCIVVTRGSLP